MIDKDTLRAAKERVTAELAAVNLSRLRLGSTDKRLYAYVKGVKDNPHGHNLWEQCAVLRFTRMVARYGINRKAVKRFIAFYEHLALPGKQGLQRYRLTPVQVFQFTNIYGFTLPGGTRLTREAVLYVPRKFSKTTSTAALAIYDLIFGEANAEAYVGANSFDQARKCFDVIRAAIRDLDPTERLFQVNQQIIRSKEIGRTSLAQCLTANARTKDGLNASTIIMDEFSQAPDSNLYTVLTTSMGVRDNPLTVIITTASDNFTGPFYSMLEGYKRILLGEVEDDTVFAHIFEPDIDDAEDDEATWEKVHPHIGVTVSLDFYRREYQAALRNGAEAMLAFRTKLLNIYSENETRAWISATEARAAMRPIKMDGISGRPDAMVAIDLSESDDFSAVSTGFYNASNKTISLHTAYFFPEGALSGHPNEALYRGWALAGHLKLTKGKVIDYREIADYIIGLNQYTRQLAIGYDPWKSREIVNILGSRIRQLHGNSEQILQPIRQTYGYFTAPVEAFEHWLKTGRIFINDNPINAYCFGNAVLDSDKLENCKPIKRSHNQKIDGVITMLMCLRLFIDSKR